jgi:hypothetical protein
MSGAYDELVGAIEAATEHVHVSFYCSHASQSGGPR